MSRLKSPHRIYAWLGCALMWSVMVVWMVGMSGRSSAWEGMYILIRSQGCKGRLAMRVIWRYGEISTGVGILEMLPGKACVLWISNRRPPLYPR